MKKILSALATTAFLVVSGSALAVPIAPGSPLVLSYDFGSPISPFGVSTVSIDLVASPADPFEDNVFSFEIVDDGSGSSGLLTSEPLEAPPPGSPPELGPTSFDFAFDLSGFPLHTGDLVIIAETGSIDLIAAVFYVSDEFGDFVASDFVFEAEDGVPAPGALALLGLGLIGLGLKRRTA